jgi:hypothetical protein
MGTPISETFSRRHPPPMLSTSASVFGPESSSLCPFLSLCQRVLNLAANFSIPCIGFNSYAITDYNLGHLAPCLSAFYSAHGLFIGIQIPVDLLWLEGNKPEDVEWQ